MTCLFSASLHITIYCTHTHANLKHVWWAHHLAFKNPSLLLFQNWSWGIYKKIKKINKKSELVNQGWQFYLLGGFCTCHDSYYFYFTVLSNQSETVCLSCCSCCNTFASTLDARMLKLWLLFETLSLQQKPTPQMAPSPAPTPHILYNPTQHMLTYAGFCPSAQSLPAYPNYPLPIQVRGRLGGRGALFFW